MALFWKSTKESKILILQSITQEIGQSLDSVSSDLDNAKSVFRFEILQNSKCGRFLEQFGQIQNYKCDVIESTTRGQARAC